MVECSVGTFFLKANSKTVPSTLNNPMGSMSTFRLSAVTALLLCTGGLLSAPVRAGTSLDLETLRGQVVYLDFWASWCAPCRQSFPWMRTVQAVYVRQGLTVIAVNLDHDRAEAERFLQKYHPDFAVQFDPRGALAERFRVAGMPTSVLIDRHGVERFRHIGFRAVDQASYEQELRELLAEQ
jgi:cytochrome c biogenesis protein CcmG/thiol:disulfide interchange protein DsbE